MAQVFEGGDHYFNALTSGTPHQGTINYLTGQFNSVSSNLSEASKRFYESARISVEAAVNSDAMRLAQAATRKLRSLWDEDCIRTLVDIGDFQYAPLSMQRYVMAEPTVRAMYHQQRIDGYSDSYTDLAPSDVGEDHYEYRRVMNGVITITEPESDDEESEWSSTTYLDELLEDDNELLFEEQLEIIDSWSHIRNLIAEGKSDPTSRFNAELE